MEEILKMLNHQPVNPLSINLSAPEKTIEQFFIEHPIHTTRAHLWELYKGWTYQAAEYTDMEHTREILFFYTQLIDLLNASFIWAEKIKLEEQKKHLV